MLRSSFRFRVVGLRCFAAALSRIKAAPRIRAFSTESRHVSYHRRSRPWECRPLALKFRPELEMTQANVDRAIEGSSRIEELEPEAASKAISDYWFQGRQTSHWDDGDDAAFESDLRYRESTD